MVETYIPVSLRRLVITRAGACCEYCLIPAAYLPDILEVEHIVPRSAGGETVAENLALACPACNRLKGSHTRAPDPQTDKLVSLFQPRNQTWSHHFRWSSNITEIIGRTGAGRATVHILRMNREAIRNLRGALQDIQAHPAQAKK